jgi:hypothetical protein
MKIDFKKIINIKNKSDLKSFPLDKPIFQFNYLFHYFIMLHNLNGLKLHKFPVYIENNDGLNGFHLAAKEYNFDVLSYLIKTYPEYIYNRNLKSEAWTVYLEIEEFPHIMKSFPDLDWDDLIISGTKYPYQLLKTLIVNLSKDKLFQFLKLFNIRPEMKNPYLFAIIQNINLKTDDIIKILDTFTDEELNYKDTKSSGEGILLDALELKNEKLVDYLISRNVDYDYYTFIKAENPLILSFFTDITENKNIFTPKILNLLIKSNPQFFRQTNKYLDNIAHTIFYIRINRNKQIDSVEKFRNLNYSPDFLILKNLDSESWNQINIEKLAPFNLITKLNWDIYSHLIKPDFQIEKNVLKKISEDINIDSRWKKTMNSLKVYEKNVDLDFNDDNNNEYAHSTLFQAKFKDVGIFAIHLANKWKNQLVIPNAASYLLNNLTYENTFPFADDIISKEPIFPWIISFHNTNEYYIHPYLNNIINSERRNGQKRFAAVFISLIYENLLHANILVYDFNNMTVERFEPYGNSVLVDPDIDDVLEEDLCWNTGLKYIRPKDFLPFTGFQTISDENYAMNKKNGDYGGFCLAWCLFYLESRLKNPELKPNILVKKLINKINHSDIKFSEYIRNYSNKINEYRIQYLEKAGVNSKDISNSQMSFDTNQKVTKYLVNRFNGNYPN